MDATFELSVDDAAASLTVRGVLDAEARAPLERRLADLDATGAGVLRLDLGGVVHVDSSCLRLVDEAMGRAAARGATVRLVASSTAFALMSRVGGHADLAALAEAARTR